MPKIGEMIESKYLKKEDIHEGEAVVTVAGVKQGNIAMDDQPQELKWMIKFQEFAKPMVLNSTNIQLLAKACGSDDTDEWTGKKVVLYVDDNVSFGGKLVGGLRIRAIKKKSAALAELEDDVPF